MTSLSHSPPIKPDHRSSSHAPGRPPSRHGCLHGELPVSSHHRPIWAHHHHRGPPPQPPEPSVAPPETQLRRSTSSRGGQRPATPPAPGRTRPPVRRILAGPPAVGAQGLHCEFPILSRDPYAQQGHTCDPLKSSRDLAVKWISNSTWGFAGT
jgi:hypothetical protein